MSEAYLGEIRLLPYSFAPKGWLPCEGQLLAIASYPALYNLLGTSFGGNGSVNFALPDLCGRVVMGGSPSECGTKGGAESVVLTPDQLPMHSHTVAATQQPGQTATVANGLFATVTDGGNTAPNFYGPLSTAVTIDPDSLAGAGHGDAHYNVQPYTALQYCICTTAGLFPSR